MRNPPKAGRLDLRVVRREVLQKDLHDGSVIDCNSLAGNPVPGALAVQVVLLVRCPASFLRFGIVWHLVHRLVPAYHAMYKSIVICVLLPFFCNWGLVVLRTLFTDSHKTGVGRSWASQVFCPRWRLNQTFSGMLYAFG